MTLYRIVVLLPILDIYLAAETSDSVRGDIAMVESSSYHCRREGFYVERPGVERTKPLFPLRHEICWFMIMIMLKGKVIIHFIDESESRERVQGHMDREL